MMRIISCRKFPATALLLVLGFLLGASLLPAATAPAPGAERRWSIGIAAGGFYPVQGAFRSIYGQPLWPLELQLGWALNDKLSLWAGARYLQASGSTILLQSVQPGETYVLRLQVLALRLGLNYWLGQGRIAPFLGAGIQHAFFREAWRDLPIEAQGQKTGFFAQAGGRWRLGRSLVALLQMEYSHLPGGKGSGAKETVDLGGLGLTLGIRAGLL
jgi:hypothetical protein